MRSTAVASSSSPSIRAAPGRRGFTFVELLVVAAILTVLAGVVVYAGDTGSEARIQATRASEIAIRDAICGTQGAPGFVTDLGEAPIHLADLFVPPPFLPSGAQPSPFDRFTGRGWNGPYLVRNTGRYTLAPAGGFTNLYGNGGDPALIDAWGHAIVLQWPTQAGLPLAERQAYTRLVSAGPDGVLNTSPNVLAPDLGDANQVGDDVVAYLFRANGP